MLLNKKHKDQEKNLPGCVHTDALGEGNIHHHGHNKVVKSLHCYGCGLALPLEPKCPGIGVAKHEGNSIASLLFFRKHYLRYALLQHDKKMSATYSADDALEKFLLPLFESSFNPIEWNKKQRINHHVKIKTEPIGDFGRQMTEMSMTSSGKNNGQLTVTFSKILDFKKTLSRSDIFENIRESRRYTFRLPAKPTYIELLMQKRKEEKHKCKEMISKIIQQKVEREKQEILMIAVNNKQFKQHHHVVICKDHALHVKMSTSKRNELLNPRLCTKISVTRTKYEDAWNVPFLSQGWNCVYGSLKALNFFSVVAADLNEDIAKLIFNMYDEDEESDISSEEINNGMRAIIEYKYRKLVPRKATSSNICQACQKQIASPVSFPV